MKFVDLTSTQARFESKQFNSAKDGHDEFDRVL